MKARDLMGSVAAVVPAAATEPDIRDVRGLISIPTMWPTLLIAAGVAATLVALGFATYWLVRRLRRARIKTAAELAIERLEAARALAREGRAAELAAELSDAVRVYIEARFGLRAAHRTTEEFLRELVANRASPVTGHRQQLGDFLGACDLAKFARFALDVEHMGAMIDAAQSFVRATAQPAASAPAPAAAGATPALEARV